MTSKLALARIERGRAIQGAKDMRRTNRELVKRIEELEALLVDAGTHAALAQDLVDSVMAWWEEHQYDTTGEMGDFDEGPEFVTQARHLVRPRP